MFGGVRRHAWLALALAGTAIIAVAPTARARADDVPAIVLDGMGDGDVIAEIVGWQDTLFSQDHPIDLPFLERGSRLSRAALLTGAKDYIISGVPFTDDELGSRPAGSGAILSVPIAVSALAIVATTPIDGWTTETIPAGCDPNDPDFDPVACAPVQTPFLGPIRVPAENLSAMMLNLSYNFHGNNLVSWNSPAIEAALGTSQLTIQGITGKHHTFVVRADGSAVNKYMMEYAKTLGPTAWTLRLEENPDYGWEPVSENLSPRSIARQGASGVVSQLRTYQLDPATNNFALGTLSTGSMAGVMSTDLVQMNQDAPDAKFRVVEVQNRHGDWVAPTRESIEAAANAGDTPNIGATNDVAGAYPLTWTTRMYTVAGSLDPDQANALAGSIRFIVTDGQQSIIDNGGAPLTAALRAEALAGANAIVTANCIAAGYEVTTGGPGPLDPDTPQVQALTGLAHCTAVPPPPTTTTTTSTTIATTTTVVRSSSPGGPRITSPPFVAPVEETTTTVAVDTVPAVTTTTSAVASEAPGSGGTRLRGRALTSLPQALPSDGTTGFQKLGTLMLGASTFLGLQRLVLSRRRLPL